MVVAPQAFKGSADAVAVAAAIARGFRRVLPDAQLDEVPLADGGEGTVHALVRATKGSIRTSRVHDPLLREIDADWGILGDATTAVIEEEHLAVNLRPIGMRLPNGRQRALAQSLVSDRGHSARRESAAQKRGGIDGRCVGAGQRFQNR